MRKIAFALLILVFITGCTLGNAPDVIPKQINVIWRNVPNEGIQALSEEGGLK